ncbi:hypothetical protein L1987_73385 [Smallanthus sonchifolius]|uniref:Uncharacterized protein n=1 Tax=Smallanthus sonchifolius TaxID=185202 RepID=A0ACB9A0U0_9ASTR|nr:hypothetical protein L1987_73385 [Smallanthus sonchifolius]
MLVVVTLKPTIFVLTLQLLKCMERTSEVESAPSTSSSRSNFSDHLHNNWLEAQDSLKKKLVTVDDYTWKLGEAEEEESSGVELLKYIGGVDISFSKDNPSVACGTLVVLDFKTLDVVYEDSSIVKIDVPGFLAFREAPIFLELLKKMQDCSHPFYPQLLMIDGNGILHPREFVISFKLHHVDGLTNSRVRELLEAEENFNVDCISLVGDSGKNLGAAIHSSKGSFKPIFVSVGHRVSLASAVEVVKRTCKYRVPEPIRQVPESIGLNDVVWRGVTEYLVAVEELRIRDCNEIRYMWESEIVASKVLVKLRKLVVENCDNLLSLGEKEEEDNSRSNFLTSLRVLHVSNCNKMERCRLKCPRLDFCGGWPPKLQSLRIGKLKKPISEWGPQNFPTSLVLLGLYGGEDGVSSCSQFSHLLPSSLTSLLINDFEKLESVSMGLQHLTSLQHLNDKVVSMNYFLVLHYIQNITVDLLLPPLEIKPNLPTISSFHPSRSNRTSLR